MPATIQDIIERYLTSAEKNNLHGAEAAAERRRVLTAFAQAQAEGRPIGAYPVGDCLPHFLSDWIEAQPSWRTGSTRRAKARMVNAAFNWAQRGRRIPENPFRTVTYRESRPRPLLPDADLAKILEHAPPAFALACGFLRLTGCRLSELCRVRWEFVDWANRVIILRQHKSADATGKPRLIVLTDGAIDVLKKMQPIGEGLVFTNGRGHQWTRRTLGQQYTRIKDRLGLATSASLHGIRHQAATAALKEGAPLKFVSLMLGHASTAITERYYAHVDGELDQIRKAAQAGQKKDLRAPSE